MTGEELLTLANGRRVLLRPVRPDDKPLFVEGFRGLSEQSRHLRFFTPRKGLTAQDLRYLTEVDGRDHYAVVAIETDAAGVAHGAGVARFVRLPERPDVAEMAIVVVDRYQGLGLGGVLLQRLLRAARARGVRTLVAEFLAANRRTAEALRRAAPGGILATAGRILRYEFPTD